MIPLYYKFEILHKLVFVKYLTQSNALLLQSFL